MNNPGRNRLALILALLAMASWGIAPAWAGPKDKDTPTTLPSPPSLTSSAPAQPHAKSVDPKTLDKAKEIYQKHAKAAGNGEISLEGMKELYAMGGFETIKTLIENKVIAPRHSEQMADLRILMMLQTWEAVVKAQQQQGKTIRVHRSDSGNQKAGMSSDVDQTIYVEEYKDGKWMRSEALDPVVGQMFKDEFQKMHKLSVEALDIATISGKDKFPDWRMTQVQLDAQGLRPFQLHAVETLYALEHTPGAYQECGAVVQQMQLRAEALIEKNLRQGKDTPLPAEPREMIKALREHNPKLRLNQLVFLTISADPADGAASDGQVKAREAFVEDAIRVMFDGLKPQLIRGHAYDAAVANYLEFLHHTSDKNPAVKYHLRSLDDGLNTYRRLDPQGSADLQRVEYARIEPSKRKAYLENLLGKDLAQPRWDGSSFMDRWKMAFDISAKLRDLHSSKQLNDQTSAEVFRSLAEQQAGKAGRPAEEWSKFLEQARLEYDQRCIEFMTYNIIETSNSRVMEWLSADSTDPRSRAAFEASLDEAAIRRELNMEGSQHDAKWAANKAEYLKQFSDLARLELVSTFRKLGERPDLVKLIVERAQLRNLPPQDLANLKTIVWESSGIFLGKMEYRQMPELYARYYLAQVRQGIQPPKVYAQQMMEFLSREYGFIDTPDGPRPTRMLKILGFHGLHERVTKGMQEHRLAGVTDRFLGNMFMNIGSLQSATTVLRAYSESNGDWEETYPVMVNELLNMTPGIGLVKGAYDGGLDPKQQFLFVVGMKIPAVGVILALYTMGENGIVLYEHEYARPLTNQVADAIYRGYTGPSLYNFAQDNQPVPFDSKDADLLDRVNQQVKELQAKVQQADSTVDDGKMLARATRVQRLLQEKKSAWKAWEAENDRSRGGAILGLGGQAQQKPLELGKPTDPLFADAPLGAPGPLLGRVKPIIFYARSNEGPIDFTIAPLTAAQQDQMNQLRQKLDQNLPPHEWVQYKHQWAVLDAQHRQQQRAQRYLERAKTNHELMHQIQRDSMYPFLLQDDATLTTMLNPREYCASWVSIRRDMLAAALKKIEASEQFPPHSRQVLDALAERLGEDMERSKRLWLSYQHMEKAKAKAMEQMLEREKGAYAAEVVMQAARDKPVQLSDPARGALESVGRSDRDIASLSPISQAYLERHIPHAPPSFSVRMRRVPSRSDSADAMYEFRPDVQVTADPNIYKPPYLFVSYLLDPKAAQAAASSRNHLGLPLDQPMIQNLNQYLKANPVTPIKDPKKDRFTPAVLTFVFCSEVQIPQRIIALTTADLPLLTRYDIPAPKGLNLPPQRKFGYLFGGAAYAPEPEKLISGPLQIVLKRMKKNDWNGIEVTSQALAQLDPQKPDIGVRFTVLRALSPGGPFEEFNRFFVHYCFPDTPVFQPSEKEPEPVLFGRSCVRTGKDTFLIQDHMTPRDDKLPHQPVYYQVVQTAVQGREGPKPRGKELKSNIAGPGQPELVLWVPGMGSSQENMKTDSDGWLTLGARLGLDNQAFNARKVRYQVSCGSWKGYFWGALKAMVPPTGGTISVSAEGEGMNASASLEVTPDPERQKQIAKDLEYAQKRLAEPDNMEKRIADAKKRFEDDQRSFDVQTKNARQTPGDQLSLAGYQRDLIRSRYAYQCESQGEGPRVKLMRQREVMRAQRDYAGQYDLYMAEYAIAQAMEPIEEERRTQIAAVLAKVKGLGIPDSDRDLKSSADRLRNDLEMELKGGRMVPVSRTGALQGALYAAFMAGDAGKFESALGKLSALPAQTEAQKNELSRIYYSAVEQLVMLTGDGRKAADLLNKARAIDLELNPSRAASYKQNWERNKPAWWPE